MRTRRICLWDTFCRPYQWKDIQLLPLSNNAAEAIKSKSCLEAIAKDEGIKIESFHSDNGIFLSSAFKEDHSSKQQKILFSS